MTGSKCWALVLAAAMGSAVACGSKQKPDRPHALDEDTGRADCTAGDMTACVDLARASCTEAWEIEYEGSPPLYLTSSGLIRLDRPGMVLYGTNGAEWMACVETCPGGGNKVCLPYGLEMELRADRASGCAATHRDILPWNGLDAKVLNLDCPDGAWEVTYVPSLAPAQKALVAAGAVDAEDLLAGVAGLVVKVTFSGVQMLSVAQASKASCALFEPPADYRIVRGRAAYDDLRAIHPGLEQKLEAALAAQRTGDNDPEKKARQQIEPQLIDLCGKAGYAVDSPEAIDGCVAELGTARALLARVTSILLDRFAKETEPALREKLQQDYLAPLCERFAR